MTSARIQANEAQKNTEPARQPRQESARQQEQEQASVQVVAPQAAYRRAQANPNGPAASDLLALQRMGGNRQVQLLIAALSDNTDDQNQRATPVQRNRELRPQIFTPLGDFYSLVREIPADRPSLAREPTQVIQKSPSPRIQQTPNPQPKLGVQFNYSVTIDRVLDSDQLLLKLIKQYRRVATDAEATVLRDREKWHWVGSPPKVKQTDVDKGYILIPVNDLSLTPGTGAEKKKRGEYFKGLSQEQQAAINAEVDRQFWKKTKYRAGQKLGTSADDKRMSEYWKVLRDELIRKRQAIDALPPNIQEFLFDEKVPSSLDPKDFETVLRIASKVATLTPAELAEYKSRVTAKTIDWNVYEASVDRFLAERKERETTAKERRQIETRLYRLVALYDRYRTYLVLSEPGPSPGVTSNTEVAGEALGKAIATAIGTDPATKMRTELDADLIKAGFPRGIADFEKFIRDYEKVFERETLAIARVMLDQYEHLLLTQEQRYQKPDEAEALYQAVGQTKARAEYEEAKKIRSEHATSIVLTPDEMAEQAYWVGQRNKALARGEAKVRSVASAHPLVGNPDFDRERLARASSKNEVQSVMLGYTAARKKDIANTRKNLTDKPAMIYGLNTLLKASFQAQNIQSGTIYEKIIRDHISDVHWTEAIPQIVLAVIAVAAGLLTGGGGTVAVLAAGTALGIGAYQAIEEFRRYEMKSAAYGARLTSEDPTMAWVIVAVIGAGIDAGAFLSVLPKLRPALQAFNAGVEAGDVAKLTQKLDKLTDVEKGIRKSVIRAAEAEAEARAAWKAIFRPPAALRMVIIPGAEEFGRFVYAVYLSIKRGVRQFQVFVKTNEAIDLIGDVTKLSAEELAALKTGYLKAIEEMETVAAHGKALGMTENDISAFMKLRGETKGMTVEQATARMDTWKATTEAGGFKWGNPLSKPTYGHTFLDHTRKLKSSQLIERARSLKHQIGQWTNDEVAAQFIAEVAKRGEGAHEVPLSSSMGRSFLGDGTELTTDMAMIIVKPNGSVRTAYPFSSAHPR